jgi:photosystem II stability/assembly factor-like uncharacterized protein
MTTSRLFALASQSVARAECSADGDLDHAKSWTVERVLIGQDVRCLEVDPLNPEIVYAGTQGQGVFCSTDGGRNWRSVGLQGVIIKSLAASPHQPGVIYAGTKNPPLIYRTRDGGVLWEELRGFRRVRGRWWWLSPAEPPFTAYVLALTISPGDPNIVLAGVELGAVVRSADDGETWSHHRPGAGRDCHQLFFHPRQSQWAYQAHGGGPAVSRNAGLTWEQPRAGLDRRYCINVAADAERPEIWYAVVAPVLKAHSANSQARLVRSINGSAWETLGVGAGLPASYDRLPLLASDPLAPGHLYLASGHGVVWHSTDSGDTWHQLPINLGEVWFRLIAS